VSAAGALSAPQSRGPPVTVLMTGHMFRGYVSSLCIDNVSIVTQKCYQGFKENDYKKTNSFIFVRLNFKIRFFIQSNQIKETCVVGVEYLKQL
jgi:hypothetical protein